MFGMIKTSGTPDATAFVLSPLMPLLDYNTKRTGGIELKSGGLLRVFNSITAGEEFLTLDVDLIIDPENFQDIQNNLDPVLWMKMFLARMPAKLEKPGGIVVDGQLHLFNEQGSDGGGWSVYDFGDNRDNSLHFLQTGDRLTVYSAITDGLTEWEGRLEIEEAPFAMGKTAKSYMTPSLETLDRWSLLHRPATLIL